MLSIGRGQPGRHVRGLHRLAGSGRCRRQEGALFQTEDEWRKNLVRNRKINELLPRKTWPE
jgi:hypothetical protein